MEKIQYTLGPKNKIKQLFPPAEFANYDIEPKNLEDVIRHYTINSLKADNINGIKDVHVKIKNNNYEITLLGEDPDNKFSTFGERHAKIFSSDYAQKAIKGKKLLKKLNLWNPMTGYYVNDSETDGHSKWHLFPPLGLNVAAQKGILLMHYPPWAVIQGGTFENAITMTRWGQVLEAAGIPKAESGLYKTIIDINPIAAPGSGESEYPNDYFPIMMASGFFDSPERSNRDYIKSMLELYLSPPGWSEDNKYTLPLLICGSALYDPQAPGWFRCAYPEVLQKIEKGVPPKDKAPLKDRILSVDVLQTGTFKIHPDSKQETPFMIANHMIAAGVTGECTDDPSKIPDIRQYEAQDLVAATFLKLYSENPNIDPEKAKIKACLKWYGNKNGTGIPIPPIEEDKRIICALAQMDLFFNPNPPSPCYDYETALERCKRNEPLDKPCAGNIKPKKKGCGCTNED
ncbi:MAG: hypothetical protein HRT72_08050 [Flavobacteriales bacterium]|nr:hypothetical protein [Flavobacteriales bacterium]